AAQPAGRRDHDCVFLRRPSSAYVGTQHRQYPALSGKGGLLNRRRPKDNCYGFHFSSLSPALCGI
ncbi:unnamed protein product, partial [Ectocarpus sp. 12 AP-2014]